MDRGDVLRGLEQADFAQRVPRLGGMARANGVVIVSERFWAFAGVDGSLREGRMPQPPQSLRRIPIARGLVRLAGSLSPLFKREGVAKRKERYFLVAAIVAPLLLVFAPHWLGLAVGGITTGALLTWLLRGRTLFLHGAEHRAIAALEERSLRDTWNGIARPSRFSLRCGTNFAALLLPGRSLRRPLLAAARDGLHAARHLGACTRTDDGALAAAPGVAPARADLSAARSRVCSG